MKLQAPFKLLHFSTLFGRRKSKLIKMFTIVFHCCRHSVLYNNIVMKLCYKLLLKSHEKHLNRTLVVFLLLFEGSLYVC